MKGISPLFKLFFGIVFLLGSAFLIQQNLHSDEKDFRDPPRDPTLLLKHVVVAGWSHGKNIWRFSSDELLVDHQGRFLTYKGKGIGKLFADNKPFLTILAPRIRFDLLTKGVVGIGGVILKAEPSTELRTSRLYWNQYSQKLFVPGKVEIKSPYGTLKARHLILVAYKGQLKILGVSMAFDRRILQKLQEKSLFEPGFKIQD